MTHLMETKELKFHLHQPVTLKYHNNDSCNQDMLFQQTLILNRHTLVTDFENKKDTSRYIAFVSR